MGTGEEERDMQKDNDQHRKLYVGMHDGVCVVTTSDGGRTWEQGKVTPIAHAAARLSVSPAEPRRAYLAAYESGVYRTDDGGHTWQHLSSYPSDYAHSVLACPESEGAVYVGSEPAAIFRSLDGGETWEECAGFRAVPESDGWFFHAETRYSHVRDLRMAPHDPDRLYAGIEVGGVVRSHNGAESWQQSQGTDPDIHFINLSAAEPQRVYIATASGPYRSDDEGQRWELINDGLQRPYTLHITSAPDEADLVLVSVSSNAGRQNPQLYLSTNGGREWQLVEAIGSDDMVVAMDWDPGDSRRIYAATDGGGIFCSSDRGRTWEPLPVSLPTVAVGALVVG
jgi:photosystem II stability/assembly factor-like uncharacterized protein